MPKGFASVLAVAIFCGSALQPLESSSMAASSEAPVQAVEDTTATAPHLATFLLYRNERYRFSFSLPESWKGYSILTIQWTGIPTGPAKREKTEHGPIIILRHPLWTDAVPCQDIPVMVFTHPQWRKIQKCQLVVSAAPFPPSELGRNANWVFALPPRYNYAFPPGFEEVDRILQGKPLRAF